MRSERFTSPPCHSPWWNSSTDPAGPGRPKGSSPDPKYGLTPNQMDLAERILKAEMEEGMFPVSISQLAKSVKVETRKLRDLMQREGFQKYMNDLLRSDGYVVESTFWRSLALGVQVGDVRCLELYAKITGKLSTGKGSGKLTVEIKAPDGMAALPKFEADEEIEEAEIVE